MKCAWGTASCHARLMEGNVREMIVKEARDCFHTHDEGCEPEKVLRQPTAKLAYHIAIATSWWAGRTGRAKIAIPKMTNQHATYP